MTWLSITGWLYTESFAWHHAARIIIWASIIKTSRRLTGTRQYTILSYSYWREKQTCNFKERLAKQTSLSLLNTTLLFWQFQPSMRWREKSVWNKMDRLSASSSWAVVFVNKQIELCVRWINTDINTDTSDTCAGCRAAAGSKGVDDNHSLTWIPSWCWLIRTVRWNGGGVHVFFLQKGSTIVPPVCIC